MAVFESKNVPDHVYEELERTCYKVGMMLKEEIYNMPREIHGFELTVVLSAVGSLIAQVAENKYVAAENAAGVLKDTILQFGNEPS